MVQEFKLDIFKRDNVTRSELKELRNNKNIPGIFYSHDSKDSIPFYMTQQTLNEAKKSGARIFNIAVGTTKQNVIFKAVQYHPVTDEVLHIDLYGVDMKKTVTVKVQLLLTGTAVGVSNDGGVLVQPLNEIDIECLPGDIPENIEVDISQLALGDTMRAADLVLDEKFAVKTDDEQVVASVTQAMKEEDLVPDLEEEALEGEEGDAAQSDEAAAPEDSHADESKEASSENEEKTEENKD
tara:strand:- start:431 stop:1147 length:717 start_codon:yes stop_codon:yes gene_type:complete